MEHVNGWCFRGIYKGGLWENDLHVSAPISLCVCREACAFILTSVIEDARSVFAIKVVRVSFLILLKKSVSFKIIVSSIVAFDTEEGSLI